MLGAGLVSTGCIRSCSRTPNGFFRSGYRPDFPTQYSECPFVTYPSRPAHNAVRSAPRRSRCPLDRRRPTAACSRRDDRGLGGHCVAGPWRRLGPRTLLSLSVTTPLSFVTVPSPTRWPRPTSLSSWSSTASPTFGVCEKILLEAWLGAVSNDFAQFPVVVRMRKSALTTCGTCFCSSDSSSGFADGISSSGSPMSWNESIGSAMGIMRRCNKSDRYVVSS